MVLSKGKEFSILIKIDLNFPKVDSNKNLVAVEIHEVENKLAADGCEVVTPTKKQKRQRAKNVKT